MNAYFFTIISPGITVGFEETTYTVGEGRVVEVCAIIVSGMLDRDAIAGLSSVNDEAVGKTVMI